MRDADNWSSVVCSSDLSLPGVAKRLAFILDINRFATPGKLVAYFGVLPIEMSSGIDRDRSEERRVGKERSARWEPRPEQKIARRDARTSMHARTSRDVT